MCICLTRSSHSSFGVENWPDSCGTSAASLDIHPIVKLITTSIDSKAQHLQLTGPYTVPLLILSNHAAWCLNFSALSAVVPSSIGCSILTFFREFMDFELFPVLDVEYTNYKNISPMCTSIYRRTLPQASHHHDTLSSHYIAILHKDVQKPVQYVQ